MCSSCFSRDRALGHSTRKSSCCGCVGAHMGTILVTILCCLHDPVSWILGPLMIFGQLTHQPALYWGFMIWRGLFVTASLLLSVLIITPLSVLFAAGIIAHQKGDESRASPGAIFGIFLIVPIFFLSLAYLSFYTCYIVPMRSRTLIEEATSGTIIGPASGGSGDDAPLQQPHAQNAASYAPAPTPISTVPGDTSYPYIYTAPPPQNPDFLQRSQFPPSPNAL